MPSIAVKDQQGLVLRVENLVPVLRRELGKMAGHLDGLHLVPLLICQVDDAVRADDQVADAAEARLRADGQTVGEV